MVYHSQCKFTFFFLLFSTLSLYPQLLRAGASVVEKPDLGISFSILTLEEKGDTNTLVLFGIEGGFNIPIYHPADNVAIGLNPQLRLNLDASSGLDIVSQSSSFLSLDPALFATLKLNTDAAERGTKASIGGTIGIGAQYSVLFF